jgi:hypothetical protein
MTRPMNQPRKDPFHLYSLSPHSLQFQQSISRLSERKRTESEKERKYKMWPQLLCSTGIREKGRVEMGQVPTWYSVRVNVTSHWSPGELRLYSSCHQQQYRRWITRITEMTHGWRGGGGREGYSLVYEASLVQNESIQRRWHFLRLLMKSCQGKKYLLKMFKREVHDE